MTNVRRLRKGIERSVANAILIKVNQIGTLTEAFDAIETAKKQDTRRSFPIGPERRKTRL